MSRTTWRRLTPTQRGELWARWRAGESAGEIARALGRTRGGVRRTLERQGGYTPGVRRRAEVQLTLAQREEISRGISAELSARSIAAQHRQEPLDGEP